MALAPLNLIFLMWLCMIWSYSLVLRVLSTPRYDAERLVWSEDIMRFDTVLI